MTLIDILAFTFFPALMIFSAFSDMFTMTISNRISFALIAGFVVMALVKGMNLEAFMMHIACGITVLVVTFIFFARGWMGGGDAKLVSCIGLWFGFTQFFPYAIIASVFGGALTLALLSVRQLPLPAFAVSQPWIVKLHDEDTGVPYGIALAAAALLTYTETFAFK